MKYEIKKSDGVGYARKQDYEYDGTKFEADIKNGDIVKLLDGGVKEQGQFGEQDVFKIQTRNGVKKVNFNQSSLNVMIIEFGDESEDWKGKDVKILLKKGVYAGKKGIATYVVTEGYELDEYGELVKDGVKDDVEEVNIDDVPF
jgi:hypothetical protein